MGKIMRYLLDVVSLELYQDKCTGCGRCVEVCPHAVFALDNKKARIIDKNLCMECGACAMNCAPGAITVNAGVGCASAMINGMVTGKAVCCGPGEGDGCC